MSLPSRRAFIALGLLPLGCAGAPSPGDAAVDRPATAQDVDERPEGCGEVPRGNACAGSRLSYCEDMAAASLDCARYTQDAGVCREISPRYGHFCSVPRGGPCRMAVPHGSHDHVHYAHCEGAGAGCLLRVTGGVTLESECASGFGDCDASAPSRCEGSRLVVRCERGQPVAYDCASYGGRCDPTQLVCAGVTQGNRCGASFLCAPGLTCRAVEGMRGVSACAP